MGTLLRAIHWVDPHISTILGTVKKTTYKDHKRLDQPKGFLFETVYLYAFVVGCIDNYFRFGRTIWRPDFDGCY